jgi:hypothetical protein
MYTSESIDAEVGLKECGIESRHGCGIFMLGLLLWFYCRRRTRRVRAIRFLITNQERQKMLGEMYNDLIEHLKSENEDLRRRLRELSMILQKASKLAEKP